MHRRTALSVSTALLLAAPLLSACSGQARPGTAAVVGGERITTSALQAEVNDVRAAQNRTGQAAAELIASTPNLERQKLDSMLQSHIIDKMAKTAGISVSAKEIEDERQAYVEENKGAEQFEALLLQKGAMAPGQVDRFLRDRVLLTKLTAKYGNGKLEEPARTAAKALHIEVNPRYGSFDVQQIKLGVGETPWIVQRTRPEQAPAGA
ncbi:SurA N-terminal domain-containing protein [Streptomyces sp. ISL-44]|uniref:SurA N-terminal domain-containing protein n=1 Tax=unclassified Streptomyces TaxID=2593676 RepID=UPI001BE67BB9|nr:MULTISPECIES: SurA N-terminal domain-containing protein [unclassified Streptomyces]MBT2539175.1 SurA N-terminal domain-containing protein [Streptomyces sp. ISL-44]MCX5013559.1 SurA N-terminal domain-containing protein [Streptomyces sp. NBC_00555]MCX5607580.1 SurA N-terminal domain-containing protein [Streptomyces sp. NBC_00047]UUU41680.1 SurA N-terminal domain-containing protein [Streptomyces sp. NBC_00162]